MTNDKEIVEKVVEESKNFFSKGVSHIVVKDALDRDIYNAGIMKRYEKEEFTLKIDLRKSQPNKDKKTRQIIVFLSSLDFKNIFKDDFKKAITLAREDERKKWNKIDFSKHQEDVTIYKNSESPMHAIRMARKNGEQSERAKMLEKIDEEISGLVGHTVPEDVCCVNNIHRVLKKLKKSIEAME